VAKAAAATQKLPATKMWMVEKELGGWDRAQAKFFDAGEQRLQTERTAVVRLPAGQCWGLLC
jgi:ABC-type sulfate transport system substrate-binding protein